MKLLEIQNISKSFGGVKALLDVSFDVEDTEIVALIGPNGAGKTTLFNIISGLVKPNSGEILFNGSSVKSVPIHERCGIGIGRTFQHVECFGDMSVRDNLLLATEFNHQKQNITPKSFSNRSKNVLDNRYFFECIAEFTGIASYLDRQMCHLPLGLAKRTELARALCFKPKLLLLDEPASGMDMKETRDFAMLVKTCSRELGITVLYVEHDVDLVAAVSDKVVVLNFGQKIAEGTPEDVYRERKVIEAYLGT